MHFSSRAGRTSITAHSHGPPLGETPTFQIQGHFQSRDSISKANTELGVEYVNIPNIMCNIVGERRLDEVGNVHWHLLDLGAVELLNLSHHADIISGDEVDGNTLTSETSTTTDSVNVVLTVGGQIVVDDQGNLLDIDTTGQKVGGDQDTGRTGTELLHNQVTLTLVHISVHGGDGEITGSELVGKPVDLAASVAEDDSLGDGDGLVEIRQGVELPVLLLNSDVELLDTLKGKLGLLDQDADGVAHELGGDLEDVLGHGGGQENDLG